ncbi:MAG: efflux RND transporter permease subunit [Prevotellaceae bacterium]|nr:efflux RND transporter permease subunit [Prevotellaceae bacterium]
MKLETFIKRPVLSTVISVLIVILGIIGLIAMPIEQYPNIAPPTIQVRATYTGADAQTVLNSVIAPLEESINGVENMTYMTSSATNDGSANITVYFKQGTDADMAAVNVQNRVAQAQNLLPAEVVSVGVMTQKRQTSQVLIYALTSDKGQYSEDFLTNYNAINIAPVIQRVKGVGSCDGFGAKTYSMRIWLDPVKMKEHKLVPSDISSVLATQNIEAAPGKLGENYNAQFEYVLRYTGRLKTATEFENLVIYSNQDGTTLKLKDVAKVELGAQMYIVNNLVNGKPAVTNMVTQMSGSNANEIVKDVKAEMEKLSKSFPPGMEVVYGMDVTDFLYASIHEVIETLIIAFILVILVVYVFLQDFRSTIIPCIAVPVSLIGTFFFLNMFGFSINLLTLSALVLAIAIVVDDAIVVVEAVHAKLDQGYKSARTASVDAMNEISGAIISITLVMSSVFIPVSFVGGTSGTFYREFGITMAVSIIISAVNALTLSPALCAIFLKAHDPNKKMTTIDKFHLAFNTAYDKMLGRYRKLIEFFIKAKTVSVAIVVISIIALGLLMQNTRTGLIPDEDTGVVFATVSLAPGTGKEKTMQLMETMQKMFESNPAIKTTIQIVGYNFIAGQGSNQGTFIIKLKPFEERKDASMSSTETVKKIFAQSSVLKDARVMAFQPPMISGYGASNGLTLSMQDKTGGSVDKFSAITNKFLMALNQRPEIQYAMTSFNSAYPQYQISVDADKAIRAGTSPKEILSVMQGYFGGMYSSNFNAYGKLYRVYVQGLPETRIDENSLKSIYVRVNGEMAPVSSFITLKKVYGPSNIDRFNLFTSINVNVAPNEGFSTGDAMKAVQEVADQSLETGYSYEYSGLTRSESESSNNTTLIFLLCFVFIYLILSAQYESYILPLSVVLSIPFGLGGAFLFTNIFGHSNDIYTQIALIMLVGLLAKNAILIVQFALERRETGMAIKWSAILGASARLRPILMTSLAMIIGLLPLMFASGVGANGNSTLGAAAVGGMLIGMILQVLVVPSLFVIFQWLQEKVTPMKFIGLVSGENDTELKQYTNPVKTKK